MSFWSRRRSSRNRSNHNTNHIQPSTLTANGPRLQATSNPDVSVCKATPNRINDLQASLGSCRSTTETNRIKNMITTTTNTNEDFKQMTAQYNDLILTGDKLFGTGSENTNIKDVSERNKELNKMKNNLKKEIQKNDGIIERTDRDFIDEMTESPLPRKTKTLHVIEDYTMAVFATAYIFMLLACIYIYSHSNGFSIKSIITGSVSAATVTAILFSLINLIL